MKHNTAVLVVGSGPTGVMAASELVERGIPVFLIDYGDDDPVGRAAVPDRPFSWVRSNDNLQQTFFLGVNREGIPSDGVRVGAQLTPPRQFVNRAGDQLLPIEGDSFFPMQSLALGGLGAAWGSACFTFTADEMGKVGLNYSTITETAAKVTEAIGVSGPGTDPDSKYWWNSVPNSQSPLDIDDNARLLHEAYSSQRHHWLSRRFMLGRIPLAVLSSDMGDRHANPYYDLDFYGDSRGSVYRPRYTIELLKNNPLFRYIPGHLALRFEEIDGGIRLICLSGGSLCSILGRRLILCAGAIGSARLALNSIEQENRRTTILCNPYRYIPTVHLRTLGRRTTDRRHSLAQLTALCGDFQDPSRQASIQIYSYRSLLLFKLIKEMPLPAWAGTLVARSLVNSLMIFGVFSPDSQSPTKTLLLRPTSDEKVPSLFAQYLREKSEEDIRISLQKCLLKNLIGLKCLPLGVVSPGNAGSIHYAGTIPKVNPVNSSFHTDLYYRLGGFRRVFIGDASSWNWLPCKGLTFTAMCNARNVANLAAESLAHFQ